MASRWPFVARHAQLERVSSLVAAGHGVLLVGPSGMGKSALARVFVDGLPGPSPRHVVGHAALTDTPYGALAGVFDRRLDPGPTTETPAGVAAQVAPLLGRPAGRTPLLVVDDLHLLDEHSALAVLHLASDHAVTVIATAQPVPLPEGGNRLWEEGFVERLELGPLSSDEVLEFLEAALGGPVTVATAQAFARRAAGIPLVLRELVVAALDAGVLHHGEAWTLRGDPPVGSGVRELVARRVAGLPNANRRALDLVAAVEPVAAGMLTDAVPERVLDALEAAQLVTVRMGWGGKDEIATAHPIYGEVLRELMPSTRLRRHRLDMARRLESGPSPNPSDLVRAALWRLDALQPQDPRGLLTAARAARAMSLATAERLARAAVDEAGGVEATLLLAEILTHTGRAVEAARLTAGMPPDSLDDEDRQALVYCAALGQGLQSGDTSHGLALVDAVIAGEPYASDQLRALQVSMLAFDARVEEAAELGEPLLHMVDLPAPVRSLAALGVMGANYWLGRSSLVPDQLEALAPVAREARDQVPYVESSLELITVCSLLDLGEPDRALRIAEAMSTRASEDGDPFTLPRAEYCLGRVAHYRGDATAAVGHLRRCPVSISAFDGFMRRNLYGWLARAQAEAGDLEAATTSLALGSDGTRMKTYEPEWELAEAAVLAAHLDLDAAADRAAWAGSMAVDQREWMLALSAYHDAARYGGARAVLTSVRRLPTVDGDLAPWLRRHVEALSSEDGTALERVSTGLAALGAFGLAAEASDEASLALMRRSAARAAAANARRAAELRDLHRLPTPSWLVGSASTVPLTARERQVALLARDGCADATIAERLGISVRTVQTHLAHCYAKLGITDRRALETALGSGGAPAPRRTGALL